MLGSDCAMMNKTWTIFFSLCSQGSNWQIFKEKIVLVNCRERSRNYRSLRRSHWGRMQVHWVFVIDNFVRYQSSSYSIICSEILYLTNIHCPLVSPKEWYDYLIPLLTMPIRAGINIHPKQDQWNSLPCEHRWKFKEGFGNWFILRTVL